MRSLLCFFLLATLPALACTSTAARSLAVASTLSNTSVHNYVFYGRDRERISEQNFLDTARFEGAQLMYAWKELESSEGIYDFNEIEKDFSFLRSHGKRLFVQLQDTTFDPVAVAVPKYLRTDPRYHGGVTFQFDDNGQPEGLVLMRWETAVRGRLQALLRALGQAFDGKIEGISLQETSIGVTENGPHATEGFTYSTYRDAIVDTMKALKGAFPRSVAMQYANFMPGEWLPDDDHNYLRSVYQYGEEGGVGIGAPDLMPNKKAQQNHAYKFMHEMRSTTILGIAVQDGNYTGTTNTNIAPTSPWPDIVPMLDDYATNFLGVRYIFWGAEEPYFSHDVVPYFQ